MRKLIEAPSAPLHLRRRSDEKEEHLADSIWEILHHALRTIMAEIDEPAGAMKTGVKDGDRVAKKIAVPVPGRAACTHQRVDGLFGSDVYSVRNVLLRERAMRAIFPEKRAGDETKRLISSAPLFRVHIVPDRDLHIHVSRVEQHGLGERKQKLLARCASLPPELPARFVTWGLPCTFGDKEGITRPFLFDDMETIDGARLIELPEATAAPTPSEIMSSLREAIRKAHSSRGR